MRIEHLAVRVGALGLGLAGCVASGGGPQVPVVAASVSLNLFTAERCTYLGAGTWFAEEDALLTLKHAAAERDATLILALEPELAGQHVADVEHGIKGIRTDAVAVKVVRCPQDVQAELLDHATVLDNR